jgi:Zn-dependent protease with chaperone function
MDAVWFWMGEYVLQSILHSLIAAVVVEILLHVWGERRPEVRLRFLLLVLLVSVMSFPLFQWMDPQHSTFRFRSDGALFDSTAWLQLRLWDGVLLWHVGLLVLAIASLLFLIQDAGPIVFPYFHRNVRRTLYASGTEPALDTALAGLKRKVPEVPPVFVLAVQEPLLYTDGIRKGVINISRPLIESLDAEELESVLAHEVAHIARKDNAIGWLLVVLRFLVLFNPVALVAFRRMIHEREKLCDDLGCRLTGKPLALASSLAKVFRLASSGPVGSVVSPFHQLEIHSQRVRIEDRVGRLMHGHNGKGPSLPHARLGLTACALLYLLFFVV